MKVLQLNGYESPGRRFSGLALAPLLEEYDISSTHIIWQRDTTNPEVLGYEAPNNRRLNEMYARVEQRLGFQSVYYTNASELMGRKEYIEADLIHFHLIHTGYMSLLDFPAITREKPTVWTLHDPWAFSGHCIHPFSCQGWRTGCGNCPDLQIPFAVNRDSSALMFSLKQEILKRSSFEVIVASPWMENMTKASPLFDGVPVHLVPFGLDLSYFSQGSRAAARARLRIPDEAIVIGFRAEHGAFKGLEYIERALDALKDNENVWLLSTASHGPLDRFRDRFGVIELGWVNDQEVMRDFFAAQDIFLMPSVADAFGVMAIEAMASGCPVVVFEGTALPGVTGAPDVGIQVANRDASALAVAIQRLIDDPDERVRRGQLSRDLVEQVYDEKRQARHVADVYKSLLERRR
ncbi:glycosyltransferase [Rhizobium sp. LjRoot98]|uniref:glycosyltransferase n=1 Tax=Rhizobium sp. LjRoot98 TaxID=3342345 RepID=UPI003ECE0108